VRAVRRLVWRGFCLVFWVSFWAYGFYQNYQQRRLRICPRCKAEQPFPDID